MQDTTELDFNGQAIAGLGRLSYPAQRGTSPHPTYAVTPDREPLGVLDAWMGARADPGSAPAAEAPGESRRWIEGYERVAEQAAVLPTTRLVYVADREGDMLALMQRAQALAHPADWLIRSQHNRVLPGGGTRWETVAAGAALGTIRFTLPARGSRRGGVEQTVWARRIELAAGLSATCVVAREARPPAGVKPVQWRLLSNRDGVDFAAAVRLIDGYRVRWEIELLFHVVKNACRVEALQRSTMPRLERALALFLVVAWRIARLMRLGRTAPDLPAALFFEADEWRAAYVLLKKPVPRHPPRLNQVIRLIATLGGFLGRQGDGEPSVKTLWLGLQRVADFAAGLKYARAAHALWVVCNGMRCTASNASPAATPSTTAPCPTCSTSSAATRAGCPSWTPATAAPPTCRCSTAAVSKSCSTPAAAWSPARPTRGRGGCLTRRGGSPRQQSGSRHGRDRGQLLAQIPDG